MTDRRFQGRRPHCGVSSDSFAKKSITALKEKLSGFPDPGLLSGAGLGRGMTFLAIRLTLTAGRLFYCPLKFTPVTLTPFMLTDLLTGVKVYPVLLGTTV